MTSFDSVFSAKIETVAEAAWAVRQAAWAAAREADAAWEAAWFSAWGEK